MILLPLATTSGCRSRTTGNEGNFVFSYQADDDLGDFNKPIAVGARLDVTVTTVGENKAVTLSEATTEDEDILTVESFYRSRFTLVGAGVGSTLVKVRGQAQGDEEKTDSVNMQAKVPEVHDLYFDCGHSANATYLTGSSVLVNYEMSTSDGQPVIGYGYYPLTITPTEGATLKTTGKSQTRYALTAGDTAQTVTITSGIDSSFITLTLKTMADIDDLTFYPASDTVAVGQATTFTVIPMVDGKELCNATLTLSLNVQTADQCEIVTNSGRSVTVRGLQAGTCSLEVTVSQANDGAGITETHDLTIVE